MQEENGPARLNLPGICEEILKIINFAKRAC